MRCAPKSFTGEKGPPISAPQSRAADRRATVRGPRTANAERESVTRAKRSSSGTVAEVGVAADRERAEVAGRVMELLGAIGRALSKVSFSFAQARCNSITTKFAISRYLSL